MATERSKLLNRIEGDDEEHGGGVVSRNLTRLCIITSVLMFFFMIAAIALAAVLAYTKTNDNDNNKMIKPIVKPILNITTATQLNNTLCLDIDCVQVAARLTSFMNTSINPCQDMYQYSCGGWEDENILPEGIGRWGTFEQLAQKNYQFLIKTMSDGVTSESEAVNKAKQIFAACTDTAQIQADVPQALSHYLTITGGWDETNITQNNTWSIDTSLVVEHYYGSSAFFSFDIEPDDMNSSRAVIKVYSKICCGLNRIFIGLLCHCIIHYISYFVYFVAVV